MKILLGKRAKLEQTAAEIISSSIREIAKSKSKVILGIPGGRSVSGIFKKLRHQKIPWKKVHIFMVDERIVPFNSKESNYRLANDSFIHDLIKAKALPQKNVHPFIPDEHFGDDGVDEYEKEFKKVGKRFDVLLLSSGEDGHIGSLFPEHEALDDLDYFTYIDDSPKPPEKRMTATFSLIRKSGTTLALFFGKDKRDALMALNDRKVSKRECPVKVIKQMAKVFALSDTVRKR